MKIFICMKRAFYSFFTEQKISDILNKRKFLIIFKYNTLVYARVVQQIKFVKTLTENILLFKVKLNHILPLT